MATSIMEMSEPIQKSALEQDPLLSIVIPALNEEDSIESIIHRCIDAKETIQRIGHVRDIEIIVVNDGSTDRTAEIADRVANDLAEVKVVHFEKNRGYGAALMAGFEQGQGEWVSFLDADGTCDPEYFGEMCRAMHDESAAIVIGSRLGPESQMPPVRRLGNRMFAMTLGFLSGWSVTDTASGMRVIRRDVLPRLYPLPNRLQFTPAMSARAIFDDMRIVEIEMPYAERVGRSKLSVFRDGLRFLAAIFSALLLYRPNFLFNLAALVCLLLAVVCGIYPAEFYLREARLEEWMIYRILLSTFLLSCVFVIANASVMAERILNLVYPRRRRSFYEQSLAYLLTSRNLLGIAAIATLVAFCSAWPGLMEYVRTGHTSLHWSRAIVSVFLLQIAVVGVITAVLESSVSLWKAKLSYASKRRSS